MSGHCFFLARLLLAAVLLICAGNLVAYPPAAHAAGASCAPNSGTGKIGGTVTAPGGSPLNFVQVTAYTPYGVRAGAASTNSSGTYQITGLVAGAYLIEFRPGVGEWVPEWYANQTTPGAATPITLGEGATLSNVNAEVAAGGLFSGTVTGLGGGPLQSVFVTVYDSKGSSVATAYTNAAGAYTTQPGLAPGTYRIGFAGTGDFLGGFYSNAATLSTATPLTISTPTLTSGINATLAPGGKIVGTVTSAAGGTPLAGVQISASGSGGSAYDYSDASGNFTLSGLGSGRYTVTASSPTGSNFVAGKQTVDVTAPSTSAGVNFALVGGATLSGKVTGPSGPLANITVYISNQDGSFQQYVTTNASGDYSARGLPGGTYRVLFRPNQYIPEAYNDQIDFDDADLIVVPSQANVAGIDAVLARGASVAGKVTDIATSLPIEGIFVELLDLNGRRVETAFTKADGTYTIAPSIASGQYVVRFNADGRNASCAFVTAYSGGKLRIEEATRITLTAPNPTTGVDAQLSRGALLYGRISDATTGAPITSGQVTILDTQNKTVGFGRFTFLGGWYTDTAVPTGTYKLRFTDYDSGYIDKYYENSSTFEGATPVVVNLAGDYTDLNAALAPGGRIAGKVTTGDTGLPFSAGSVYVYDGAGAVVGNASINADGSYEVRTGLPSGSYRVAVSPFEAPDAAGYSDSFHGRSAARSGAVAIDVTAPATRNNIDIVMLRGVWLPMLRR